jgi:hypothetical protein
MFGQTDDNSFDLKASQAGKYLRDCWLSVCCFFLFSSFFFHLVLLGLLKSMIKGDRDDERWKVLVYDKHCSDIIGKGY